MTKLGPGKSLKRETAAADRGRALCIELHARHVEIWRKGTKERVYVEYGAIYDLGRRLASRRLQGDKGRK